MQTFTKFLIFSTILTTLRGAIVAVEKKWWETASFYQIYPRSFKDSDGDGVGDLKGITEKLPYLKEIGITATWLSPIFKSPMADFGYDTANYTEIDPLFGTMDDFENLIEKAKAVGIKIILDFVPNHTSDECEWFIKSAANDTKYKDFYVWHNGKIVDGKRQPPTNWISNFRGSQWTWHEGRQQYYLHQFHRKQPDLNYRNPKVLESMMEVLRFWLNKGISGFRVDAVPYIYEVKPDSNGNLPDEPHNPAVDNPLDYDYLSHVYTKNQPESIEFVYAIRAVMEEMNAKLGGDDRIILTEGYAPLDILLKYYGNNSVDGAQIPFNFELISNLNYDSNAYDYVEYIHKWLDNMPEGRTANWVLGNHDNSRIGSRFGKDRIDMMNMLLLTLPGCSVTYMGEEIGMTDVWVDWDRTVDPQACQSSPQEYGRLTRDPERTPFQWTDEVNAGFSDAKTTWLPIANNSHIINVKRERGIPFSHFNIYKQLHNLRGEPAFKYGDYEIEALSKNVLAIKRWWNDSVFVVLLNIMSDIELIDLKSAFKGLGNYVEYHLTTNKSIRRKGDKVKANLIMLMPYEAIVLRSL